MYCLCTIRSEKYGWVKLRDVCRFIHEMLLQTFHNYCIANITVCLQWVLGLLPSGKVVGAWC